MLGALDLDEQTVPPVAGYDNRAITSAIHHTSIGGQVQTGGGGSRIVATGAMGGKDGLDSSIEGDWTSGRRGGRGRRGRRRLGQRLAQ